MISMASPQQKAKWRLVDAKTGREIARLDQHCFDGDRYTVADYDGLRVFLRRDLGAGRLGDPVRRRPHTVGLRIELK